MPHYISHSIRRGIVMYAKADKKHVPTYRRKCFKNSFQIIRSSTANQRRHHFYLLPGCRKPLFGYYQHNGVWVSSYSRKLLEEVAAIQSKKNNQPKEQMLLRKTLDSNAPLNLMIQSKLLDLYVKANDSTLWRISDRWLGSRPFFESEGNICYFSSLPYHEPADTLFKTIGDTLSVRLRTTFPATSYFQPDL